MTRITISDLQTTELQTVSTEELNAAKGGFFFSWFWGGRGGYGYGYGGHGHGGGYGWGYGWGRR